MRPSFKLPCQVQKGIQAWKAGTFRADSEVRQEDLEALQGSQQLVWHDGGGEMPKSVRRPTFEFQKHGRTAVPLARVTGLSWENDVGLGRSHSRDRAAFLSVLSPTPDGH
jgi:hypothetical protein